MSTQDIVQKLWNLCNILRDDGITYHQYVTELTYILFLKMISENGKEEDLKAAVHKAYEEKLKKTAREQNKTVEELSKEDKDKLKGKLYGYSWDYLASLDGIDLKNYYNSILKELGEASFNEISAIYVKAVSSIEEPKNLKKIITEINKLDWYDAKKEGLGDLYEGLLQKNADEKKSGAGQYFTPRPLIDVMTELIAPAFGEKCFDPACGTFGFMIAAHRVATAGKDLYTLPDAEVVKMQDCYGGVELVPDAYRLALMNAYLHNVPAKGIECMDSLSQNAKKFKEFEILSAVWIQSHDSFGNEPPFEYPLNPLILDRVA